MIPFFKIVYTDSDGNTTQLQDYVSSFQISKASEAKKNTASLTLNNYGGQLDDLEFDLDESVTIYLDTSAITTQDPIISSVISGIEFQTSGKKKQINLKLNDRTYIFLGKLWAFAYTEEVFAGTVDEVIKNVVAHTTDDSIGGQKVTTTNVSTVDKDGNAFTTLVNMSKVWKPVYEWLTDLSVPEFTGDDRSYVFYVDQDNDLHWHYPYQKEEVYLSNAIDDSQTTINVITTGTYPSEGYLQIESEQISYTGKTATSFTGCTRGINDTTAASHLINTAVSGQVVEVGKGGVFSLKIEESNDVSYNFIIYNGGPTPAGYEYLWYKFDEGNADKEFRMKKAEYKEVGLNMKSNEIAKKESDWPSGRDQDYPTPGGSPLSGGNTYTATWTDADDAAVTVSSNSEYQDAFVTELIRRCDERAVGEFFSVGASKFKGDVTMKGNLKYNINEIITIVDNEQGINIKSRVKEIRHQINANGWSTILSCEEDEEARNLT